MRKLLLLGLAILASLSAVSEANAGLFFRHSNCSCSRVRIFRTRCRVQCVPCGQQTGTVVEEVVPAAEAPPSTNPSGPAAPDTTTNQQVPEIAPPPPIDAGPAAPAVQSSTPEETTKPTPAPTVNQGAQEEKPFQLLNPPQTPPPAPSTKPQSEPTPTPTPEAAPSEQPVNTPTPTPKPDPDFNLVTNDRGMVPPAPSSFLLVGRD